MKLTILGTGHVGAATAFCAVLRGACSELVLVNRTRDTAEGEALDLAHAASLTPDPPRVRAGDVRDADGSGVVVVTLSVPWDLDRHGSRMDLAADNLRLFREWIPKVAEHAPDATLLVVTNPVDVMTWHALKISGFAAKRVIGTGTLIDSARYRTALSGEIGVHPDDIRAYILGEHGDSQFPLLSTAVTGGERFYDSDLTRRLFERTVRSGYEVTKLKGYTNWAVATASVEIVRAIADDSRRTLPVSVLLDAATVRGWPGLAAATHGPGGTAWPGEVCLSVPAVIGRGGVRRVLRPELNADEAKALVASAAAVRAGIEAGAADGGEEERGGDG